MSPFEEAPEEFDQTIFVVKDQSIRAVEGLTLNLVKEQQRYITNLEIINIANFWYKSAYLDTVLLICETLSVPMGQEFSSLEFVCSDDYRIWTMWFSIKVYIFNTECLLLFACNVLVDALMDYLRVKDVMNKLVINFR